MCAFLLLQYYLPFVFFSWPRILVTLLDKNQALKSTRYLLSGLSECDKIFSRNKHCTGARAQ